MVGAKNLFKSVRNRIFIYFLLISFLISGLLIFSKNPVISFVESRPLLATSPERLESDVKTVSGFIGRNLEKPVMLEKAGDFISAEMKSLGFDVHEQVYSVHDRKVKNLIFFYGAQDDPERIVIGAHYDVFSNLAGADDNASGVAGLLELARLLATNKPHLNQAIELVFYTLEEPPYYDTELMGSLVHAKSLKKANIQVRLMISLEMIGHYSDKENSQSFPIPILNLIYPSKGNYIVIVGNISGIKPVRQTKAAFERYSDLPVYSINTIELVQGIDWSDHRSYWSQGYPAIMVTDTSYLRNKNYHEAADTAEKLDFQRMAKVVNGVYGIVTTY